MSRAPLVVLGDTLFDVDVTGAVRRCCPDAPTAPVVDIESTVPRPGGAGLAATLLAAEGIPVRLVTALCADEEGEWLAETLGERVDLVAGPGNGSTCVKVRVLNGTGPLVRLDYGSARAAGASDAMVEALDGAATVLVSDYGRGMSADPTIRAALTAIARRVPVIWDPHPRGTGPVPDCAVVTPNLGEARQALLPLPLNGPATEDGLTAARLLPERWAARAAVVTLGAFGAALGRTDQEPRLLPAPAVPAGADTCGAGDCFAAALASALRRGECPVTAAAEAVRRASCFVRHGGAGAVRCTGAPPESAGPPAPVIQAMTVTERRAP